MTLAVELPTPDPTLGETVLDKTNPAYRGRGLATRLVSAVGAGIADRGDRVLLHGLATNPAIGLYLHLGFRLRRLTEFRSVTAPA